MSSMHGGLMSPLTRSANVAARISCLSAIDLELSTTSKRSTLSALSSGCPPPLPPLVLLVLPLPPLPPTLTEVMHPPSAATHKPIVQAAPHLENRTLMAVS